LFDLLVEVGVADRHAGRVKELTELIQFGRFQRDGITGLDVHRHDIVAEEHVSAKVDDIAPAATDGLTRLFARVERSGGGPYSTVMPSSGTDGGGYCGSMAVSASTIRVATASELAHL
jgi:hypothetical protein